MNFLAPTMLFGAAAVGVPIALHFFYKARYRKLPWAAMEFLKEAIEQTSRRLKFQEWILLALRCLAILLLALALARPGMHFAGSSGRGDAVDAVLVIDTSFSMGAQDGEMTRLQRAKDAALGIIDNLPANSTVQIVSCADRAKLLGPRTRWNLDQARQLIPTIEPTGLASDLLPGLVLALETAEAGTSPFKEIYVFSDMQKLAFERQQGGIRDKCDEIRRKANLLFIRCGNESRKVPNIAVLDVEARATIPHTNSRVPFVITLKNTGPEPVKGVKVGLSLADKAVEKDEYTLDEIGKDEVVTVTLTGSLDEPGPKVLTVRLTGDGLPGDNQFSKLIVVRDIIRVLIVDGSPNDDKPAESASHFTRNALTPVTPDRTDDYFVRPQILRTDQVNTAVLQHFDVVFLLDAAVNTLPADFIPRLKEFVAAGGGLIIGCGDNVNAADYNRLLGSTGAKLLPFDLTTVQNQPETSPFAPALDTLVQESFLRRFAVEPQMRSALERVTATRLFGVNETGPQAIGGSVLLRTADQKPFIATRVVGLGEVVFVSTSLDERWSTFPGRSSDAFVSFVQIAMTHLTSRKAAGGTRTAGDPLVWTPPESDAGYELVMPLRPGEKFRRRVRLEKPEPKPGERSTITATDTAESGIYNIVPDGKADDAGPTFAVNPDLRESANLAIAENKELAKMLDYDAIIIPAGAGTEAAVNQTRVRNEWTERVLLALLVLLVAESAWAWICGRAW
jgi:hypothetical protein